MARTEVSEGEREWLERLMDNLGVVGDVSRVGVGVERVWEWVRSGSEVGKLWGRRRGRDGGHPRDCRCTTPGWPKIRKWSLPDGSCKPLLIM